jgi:hypothetical protein
LRAQEREQKQIPFGDDNQKATATAKAENTGISPLRDGRGCRPSLRSR